MGEEGDEWDWEDDDPQAGAGSAEEAEELDEEMEQKVQVAMQRLKNFQYDLADDVVMARINKELKSIPFPKFIHYYRKKSDETDLASLTINNELNRMDYQVVFQGEKTTDKTIIREIFNKTRKNEIWCLANQSIYGDILTTLQMYFLSSELCITISNSDSHFVIDVDSHCLHSESTFAIGCNKMVELATIKSSITVSLRDEAIKQVLYSPELMMVFDQNLREAAIAVVEIEGTYQSYQMREEEGSSHGGGRDSLRDRIENIDIEAVRERLLETSHVVIGHVGGFLNKLPVVGNIIDNLTEEDKDDGIIDFTDTTGLGDDPDNDSDSADDEPGPVNVKAITGTLFSWGSTIATGIGNIVERVTDDNKQPTLYRRESGDDQTRGERATEKARKSFAARTQTTSAPSSRSRPSTYDNLPDSAPLSFKQTEEENVTLRASGTGTTTDLLDFGGDSNTSTATPGTGACTETGAETGSGDLLDLLSTASIANDAASAGKNIGNSNTTATVPEVVALRKKKGNR